MDDNATPLTDRRRRSRLSFLLLVAIALVPVVGAWLLYFYGDQFAPPDYSNQGELIQPPVQLGTLDETLETLSGHWTLLIPVDSASCDDVCERALYLTRQAHRALGRDAGRVQRAVLLGVAPDRDFAALLQRDHPRAKQLALPPGAGEGLREIVDRPEMTGHVFVSDPLGNVMMYYTPLHGGEAMIDDLETLLRLSNIG